MNAGEGCHFTDSSTKILSWPNANTVTGAIAPVVAKFPTLVSGSGFAYAP